MAWTEIRKMCIEGKKTVEWNSTEQMSKNIWKQLYTSGDYAKRIRYQKGFNNSVILETWDKTCPAIVTAIRFKK